MPIRHSRMNKIIKRNTVNLTIGLLAWSLILSACAAAAPSGPLAPDGIVQEIYFAPFPHSISLDGDLSDWEDIPRVRLPAGGDEVSASTSLSFAAAADEEYLYLMGDVIDETIVSGEHGDDYWNEDSLEFYLNATGNLSLTAYEEGVVQVTIPPVNIGMEEEKPILGGVRHKDARAQVEVVKTENGYAVEVALPLETDVWGIRPEHGAVLGFQVHLNGASELDREIKLIWSKFDSNDSSYYDPSVFGELIFFEIGQEEPARLEIQPTEAQMLVPVDDNALYLQEDASIGDRVEDLLARMTLAEKIGQMTLVEKNSIRDEDIAAMHIGGLLSGGGGYPSGGNTPELWAAMVDGFQNQAEDSRLGIPLIYGVDAIHGHSNVYGAVVFPHNIGLGAANDTALVEAIGRSTALEMAATGIYWNYAPAVMVPQDIRWGRTYEGYSEDPEIVATLGAAYLRGLQSPNLFESNVVIGTPKHFVGDGGTVWGSGEGNYQIDQGVTEVDEATLRSIHLPPYEALIAEGARSIMISFSSWGGMKMHAQEYLITDVLKNELGFTGFVVSDWGGIDHIPGTYYDAVVASVNAGMDMNMVPYD